MVEQKRRAHQPATPASCNFCTRNRHGTVAVVSAPDPLAELDPDAALVAAMVAGDRSALAALYDRYAGQMLALAMRIVRDRREAEDLLHDVFLEVWRAAASFDPNRGRVRTWIAVRMRSRALDQQKSARVARNAGDAGLDRVEALAPAPALDRGKVTAALGALSVEQRQIVELAYFDGMSCSEIAEQLHIPIGTVKSRAAAAMGRLRAMLAPTRHEVAS